MKQIIKNNLLILGIIAGVILGGITGSLYPEFGTDLKIIGEIFLDLLKMIVLPLIIVSVTLSIMKLGSPGRLGLKTLIYYTVTTGISVFIGIVVVTVIHPGEGTSFITGNMPGVLSGKEQMGVSDILETLVTPNIFKAAADYQILPLIVVSVLFGVAFGKLGNDNELIIKIFHILDKAIMLVVHWIIALTPVGIFALIASRLGEAGGGSEVLNLVNQLGKYVLSVVIGLAIHAFLVLPLILTVLGKRNPLTYISSLGQALLTALSTSSSSATLPLTMTNVIEDAGVSDRVGRFVLPLGATINMDGTALYEAVAVIFIAQSYGVTLGVPELVIIFLTATLAAVGAAGIPEAGLVTMVLVLQAVGLPLEGIGLILAIDWLLDRFRTTVNVWGDSVGAAVIDQLEKKKE